MHSTGSGTVQIYSATTGTAIVLVVVPVHVDLPVLVAVRLVGSVDASCFCRFSLAAMEDMLHRKYNSVALAAMRWRGCHESDVSVIASLGIVIALP